MGNFARTKIGSDLRSDRKNRALTESAYIHAPKTSISTIFIFGGDYLCLRTARLGRAQIKQTLIGYPENIFALR